jgi:hypothetical protein
LALDRMANARDGEAGRWWVEGQGRGRTRLAMSPPHAQGAPGPLAAVIPLDATLPARLAALSRLWRSLGRGGPPFDDPITPQRRARMKVMLRALDGRIDGAAYRDIAIALYGAARVAATPWKSSALRDTTLRLVRDGWAMAGGGYQALLRGGRAVP